MEKKDVYNLEAQYKAFLERSGLKESTMSPMQKEQLKHTFYAAVGAVMQILVEVSELTEAQGAEMLGRINKQVVEYFLIQSQQQN